MAYPTLAGTIIVRDIHLDDKATHAGTGQPNSAIVTVRQAEINVVWNTVFDEVIQIREGNLEDLSAHIDLSDPLRIFYCLKSPSCERPNTPAAKAGSEAESRARLAETTAPENTALDSTEVRKPLQLQIASYAVKGGSIYVRKGDQETEFRLVVLKGKDIALPLREQSITLEADIVAVPQADTASKPIPIRGTLSWDGKKRTLRIELHTKNLPLTIVSRLFPELFGGGKQPLGPIQLSDTGTLSGSLSLEYHQETGQWKII